MHHVLLLFAVNLSFYPSSHPLASSSSQQLGITVPSIHYIRVPFTGDHFIAQNWSARNCPEVLVSSIHTTNCLFSMPLHLNCLPRSLLSSRHWLFTIPIPDVPLWTTFKTRCLHPFEVRMLEATATRSRNGRFHSASSLPYTTERLMRDVCPITPRNWWKDNRRLQSVNIPEKSVVYPSPVRRYPRIQLT
jgi:hypothetical protein